VSGGHPITQIRGFSDNYLYPPAHRQWCTFSVLTVVFGAIFEKGGHIDYLHIKGLIWTA